MLTFVAPPFDRTPEKNIKYFWWSWNPQYPRWSKSCWGAPTMEEALLKISTPMVFSDLKYYHNKLIREGDGTYLEVFDLPFDLKNFTKKIRFYLFGSGGQRHEEGIKEFPLDYTKEDIDEELMNWVDDLHCHSEYIRFGWEGEADETKNR